MPIEDLYKTINAMAPMRKEFEKTTDVISRARHAQERYVESLQQNETKVTPEQTPPPPPSEQPPKSSAAMLLGQPSTALQIFMIANATGAYQSFKDGFSDIAGQYSSSMYGQESGIRAKNMTDNAISFAAAGALIAWPIGVSAALLAGLAGLLSGTAWGAVRGETQISANKDDSFRELVRGKFDEVIRQQNNRLQDGVAIAAAREEQAGGDQTYLKLQAEIEQMQSEINAAGGEAYIAKRKEDLIEQKKYLTANKDVMMETQRKIGTFKAEVENEQNTIIRQSTMAAYQKINSEGLSGAEAERVLMAAQVAGDNQFRSGKEGSKYAEQLASEKQLVADLQAELAIGWDKFGYEMGQSFSKGVQGSLFLRYYRDGFVPQIPTSSKDTLPGWMGDDGNNYSYINDTHTGFPMQSYMKTLAYGLSYVPFDNFPALLHQGERVLTASENRSIGTASGMPTINISGGITVREEADISRIAAELARQLERASMIYAGRW